MKSCRAVVFYATQDIRVEEVPLPACSDKEIRVQVNACAVCGSDLKAFHAGNPRIQPPMVIGHEFTGSIEKVGGKVSGFSVGERIVMATSVSCGACLYCRRGWQNLCVDLAPMGYRYPGGMAEFVTIPSQALREGHVIKVPGNVKPEHAALAEPISCAVNAAEVSGIQPDDVVAVLGAGPMGILNACVALQRGARKIILSEVNETRRKRAAEFGFDRIINPEKEDPVEIIKEETGGYGADVVIVAAPAAAPQEQAVHMARKRGTVCLFASLPPTRSMLKLDSRAIHYGEIRIVGTSDSTPAHVKKAVTLLSDDSLPAEKVVTHVLKLKDILEAFTLMECGEALRIVLVP